MPNHADLLHIHSINTLMQKCNMPVCKYKLINMKNRDKLQGNVTRQNYCDQTSGVSHSGVRLWAGGD